MLVFENKQRDVLIYFDLTLITLHNPLRLKQNKATNNIKTQVEDHGKIQEMGHKRNIVYNVLNLSVGFSVNMSKY